MYMPIPIAKTIDSLTLLVLLSLIKLTTEELFMHLQMAATELNELDQALMSMTAARLPPQDETPVGGGDCHPLHSTLCTCGTKKTPNNTEKKLFLNSK